MAVNIETINQTANNYVSDVRNAMSIDKVYLFGSYAKGTADRHSDIDLCFFSHSFENQRLVDIVIALMKLARKYRGFDIEPHAFPTSELTNDNPFVKEILKTGKEL
jgi:predicted nucleotidyltransferase